MAPKKQRKNRGVARAKATKKISARSERKAPRGGGKNSGGTDNTDVSLEP